MSAKKDLLKILRAYTLKNRNPNLYFDNFFQFLQRYLEKFGSDFKDLSAFQGQALRDELKKICRELQEEGVCSLQTLQDKIQLIRYEGYDIEIVEQAYRKILAQGEIPYPSTDSLKINPPPESVTTVNIKTEFVDYLQKKADTPFLINLAIPSLEKTVIISSRLLERPLIDTVLQKIRNYLRHSKNASYIQQRILPVFRQKERLLQNLMATAIMKPDLSIQELMSPRDLTFQFWTQVSNSILKEYLPKKEKLEEEMDLCFASYLVGVYAVYYKGLVQKERESEQALRALSQNLDKRPYAFTFQDLYKLKDDRGRSLVRRIDQKSFHDFFDRGTRSPDAVTLPEIIKLKTSDGKEYFIRRNMVARTLLERVYGLSQDFKAHYQELWIDSLMEGTKLPEMMDEESFRRDVEARLKEEDPLFHGLLNFSLLYLIHEQVSLPENEKTFLAELFDLKTRSLVGMNQILGLSRKTLYDDARLRLPFWKVVPILNFLVKLLDRLFRPGPRDKAPKKKKATKKGVKADASRESSGEGEKKARAQRFRQEIHSLREQYIGEGGDLRAQREKIGGRWNPLLDPQAQENLFEDVNALIRDYVRKLKLAVHLRAPDPARLENLAEDLSRNQALAKIKDKANLKTYIALYMIEILEKV